MHNRLAIVIPAYKGKFLTETLDSIARQDCMSFTLYIGDDCSPDDIGSIAEKYRDRINIIYRRFPENLGKTDLLAHWERCIAMTSEPYIHFFSDDDILPPDAVSRALEHVNKFPDREFFRFSLDTIDENSAVQTEEVVRGIYGVACMVFRRCHMVSHGKGKRHCQHPRQSRMLEKCRRMQHIQQQQVRQGET